VLSTLLATPRSDVAISVITEGELRTGAAKSTTPKKTKTRLENFLAPLQVLAFEQADADIYRTVRARLEKAGTPIGPSTPSSRRTRCPASSPSSPTTCGNSNG